MYMYIPHSIHIMYHICIYMQAIYLWERVCKLIEEREKQLDQLQTFEKSASDPSRLFSRGIIYTCACIVMYTCRLAYEANVATLYIWFLYIVHYIDTT